MHTITIDNPSAFATGARRSSQMRWCSLRRRLVTIRAAALRVLLDVAAIVILVLIPWNAAS